MTAEVEVSTIEEGLQQFSQYGVTNRRAAETDLGCFQCDSGKPTAGKRLLTSWGRHVFVWEGGGEAVILQTDEMERIKPLSNEPVIDCGFIPGGIEPIDVFRQPQAARLIHIGVAIDEEKLTEIKARTGVGELIDIPVNSAQNPWVWDEFEVKYENECSQISVFPGNGDSWLSFRIANSEQEEMLSFFGYGKNYFEGGGVVKLPFMKDAFSLGYEEMQRKYPRNSLYLGRPEDFAAQVDNMSQRTHIQFTDLQKKLYVNLRLIPENKPGAVVRERDDSVYYCSPQDQNHRESVFSLMHPIKLGEIGLLGETLKFTNDRVRMRALQNYLRIQDFIYQH